eukprot:m.1276776 g.1276776  ORF g.1276776 m.1276776 type:complete len:71 (+) comp24763_c0_seq6:2692-2904(+)
MVSPTPFIHTFRDTTYQTSRTSLFVVTHSPAKISVCAFETMEFTIKYLVFSLRVQVCACVVVTHTSRKDT